MILLFGEIEGTRFQGRPNTQWIDNVVKDMKTFNISENPKEDWIRIKGLVMDRMKWRNLLDTKNIEKVKHEWFDRNKNRRIKRMIRKGVLPRECKDSNSNDFRNVENPIDRIELELDFNPELLALDKLSRTPMLMKPDGSKPNIVAKLGYRLAEELYDSCRKVALDEQVKMDPYTPWNKANIVYNVEESQEDKFECLEKWKRQDDIEARKKSRDEQIEEWMLTSNVFDQIRDAEEEFIISSIADCRKKRNGFQYLVIYEPRVLSADEDFPEEFPEVKGLPWVVTEDDWMMTTILSRRIGNDDTLIQEMRECKNRLV